MDQEISASAPVVEATPAPVEVEHSQAEVSEQDARDSAREAFFKGYESEIVDDGEEAAEESPDSHLEVGEDKKDPAEEPVVEDPVEEEAITEFNVKVDLSDLPIPHKFKPQVQKKVDAILADARGQAEKLTGGYRESNAAFAKAFVDIIRSDNPLATLKGYAEEMAQVVEIPADVLQNLEKRIGAPADGKGQGDDGADAAPNLDVAGIQARVQEEMAKIDDRYWPLLNTAEDPKQARDLFSKMEREKMALMNAVHSAQQKAVLMAFYQKLIKPKFDEYGNLKKDAETNKAITERSVKVSHWNTADQEITKQHPDFPKYRTKVKELLKTRFKGAKEEANSTGSGHLQLMKDIYLIVSRADHLEAAKRPNRGRPGFKPGGKHIQTQQAGGSSKEDIKRRYWSDVIPADE